VGNVSLAGALVAKRHYKKSVADRILIYLYERPQGASTTELTQSLNVRVAEVRAACETLSGEGFIGGAQHPEPTT
jgi:DNA-binding IclR family transcriptional regulator